MSIAADCEDLFLTISEGNEIYNNTYVVGEFPKWFEKVVGVEILEVNNRTVCDM